MKRCYIALLMLLLRYLQWEYRTIEASKAANLHDREWLLKRIPRCE